MPALIPVHNTLGALFIGTVFSSIIYGVTWLQVYSYYNSYCSRDPWPLKSFVTFLMLVDSTNMVFVVCTTYHIGVTNFGDYWSLRFVPWSLPAIALSGFVLEVSVQHFYAYRIYLLGKRSPYLPAAILRHLTDGFRYWDLVWYKNPEAHTRAGKSLSGFLHCCIILQRRL
ncbi:hypothetical protein BJY52DRAFT_315551 [Lactarius psammicola]|nr:hypothetical protein BJY52DRAFT_315551 [Lactarius psammicola]